MPATNNKLTSPRLSRLWTSRQSTQEATLLRSLLFSLQTQILLKRNHRLKMAAVKRRIKARINIINGTLTAPGIIIIINNNMVKENLKAKEVITIRVDKAVREEVAGEWVVQTVDMVRVTSAKDNTPIKITSMPILKQSLAV